MRKAYIYPVTARLKTGLHNPYINNFIESMQGNVEFLNANSPSTVGLFDLLKYIFKIDIIFLNWVENLPDKKGGYTQWLFFKFVFVPILRIRRVKICWTLHNKLSHDKSNTVRKKTIFENLFSLSNYIITHASEGVRLIEEMGFPGKAIFFHHPINERKREPAKEKDIDILIWGSIAPYKGVDIFLNQLNKNTQLKNAKIVIAGKVLGQDYEKVIRENLTENVQLIDRFLEDWELEAYLGRSIITLFTYNKESILSSGALSDSIGFGNIILGPNSGAFLDLFQEHLIFTYTDIELIPDHCERLLKVYHEKRIDENSVTRYLREHSWRKFAAVVLTKFGLPEKTLQ